ncbi:MAG: transglutaminase-like cysteine peptidase [Pseudomonadota bacterium]
MAAQPLGSSMVVGKITSQPIGHYRFCKENRHECRGTALKTAPPRVTDFGWSVVNEINAAVNEAVLPMTDFEIHGREEVWSYPEVVGDCEDYVLLKRAMLIEQGFSVNDLLITVVRKPNGEGHAVLTLRTADGDYVLDNLADEVKMWTETPYTYLKRQASFHAGRWVDIENGDELFVGSIPD